MSYDAFKNWYVGTKGTAATSVNQYLDSFKNVKFSDDGKAVDEVTDANDFSKRVQPLLDLKGSPEAEFRKIFVIEKDNLKFDDLKGGLGYYLEFLQSKLMNADNQEQAYIQFKFLLRRFLEQATKNKKNQGERSQTLGRDGFEQNDYYFESSIPFDHIVIAGHVFKVRLRSGPSYGPLKETQSTTVPFIQYDINDNRQVNIRVSFVNSEVKSFKVVFWNPGSKDESTDISAQIEDLDLFSDLAPNANLKKLYDSYTSIRTGETNLRVQKLAKKLETSYNIILRGAPGTGKTYLAQQIAADIISKGYFDDYTLLSDEQKKQVEFVQFHPSYDYSDFVEGLRPKTNDDGSMGFELQEGIFTKFVARAQRNYDNSQKTKEVIEKEKSIQEIMTEYFSNIEFGVDVLKIAHGTKFFITSVDDKHINILIPENPVSNKLSLNVNELREMLESDQKFNQVKDVAKFFVKLNATQGYSYDLAIYEDIKSKKTIVSTTVAKKEELKPYIFIIDEINRGEISKIFGELFFAIDPGYRGITGEVSTQYSNLHDNPDKKFSIPENVYIIGTMNDIDRSVDSFDFAMRRRFRFIEIKADERLEMLESLGEVLEEEAIKRMCALNNEISNIEELNENYHIGASYFLKLSSLSFEQLWTDYLQPLLQDYIRGMYDEEGIMKKFAKVYDFPPAKVGDGNDNVENQG
ncbi:MAG TPA: AAA family ATPase [Lactovum miscens]|uniref:McrB family protein n=1 Tax=Lactovum miscens TaxID=190387 RepID=UPI002EDA82EC